ncbi:hypothetical protein [Streptomyces benahoarensis]|uniref:Amidohydrolase 3 domain-containing protein n=1 Tax=Streptomyces benahoarensis TaxID=2595054 RepID=A0A553ZMA3_9ACTN|nr:hypothetical protein [Streptomyces benahoarensis]TSB22794.1 hypothetical protein FNJ62_15920 [Streptomyces benahoarensis]TSB42533.1 hypothetical protein FNZ23_09420 [Streptomyces benahoarensis]
MSDTAERIFTGGPVLTMDPAAPDAEALAVCDGIITAVGTVRDVLALCGAGTDVVNLKGRALLPGFVEAHGHPTLMGLALAPPAVDVRPFTVPTGREVYEGEVRLRAYVMGTPDLAAAFLTQGFPVACHVQGDVTFEPSWPPTRRRPPPLPSGCAHCDRAWNTAAPSQRTDTAAPPGSVRRSACSWTTCGGGEMCWRTTCSALRRVCCGTGPLLDYGADGGVAISERAEKRG